MAQYDFSTVVPATYEHLDDYVDNFEKIKCVETDLLWGDPQKVPAPWLSVIIPTFSRTDYLLYALQSVINQNDVPFMWEIIVIDNTPLNEHGTTGALEIVRTLNNDRILYYHNQENIGSGYNWNRGVEVARGTWISFLHDDDFLYPDALQSISRIIELKKRCKKPLGYIQGRFIEFNSQQDPLLMKHKAKKYILELTRLGTLITYYSRTGMPSFGTTILKKAYMEVGGVNYDFGPTADAVLGYQIMKNYSVFLSDRFTGAYRWEANESLKLETVQKLVYSDYLFAKYCRSQSIPAKVWDIAFGRLQHNLNVKYKARNLNRCGNAVAPEDVSPQLGYKKDNILYQGLLQMCILSYKATITLKAKINELPNIFMK